MEIMRIVVMASGRGSNFESICEAVQKKKLPLIQIVALVCNKSDAPALQIAKRFNVPTHVVESKRFITQKKFDRERYERELNTVLEKLRPDLICLAGYMLILGEKIVARWEGKLINIHPSLLPHFKGLHAQRQALEAKAEWTGCTVHFVTAELDAGPVIAQSKVKTQSGDTEDTLSERLLPVEHQTYVEALRLLSEKRVVYPTK